MASSAGWHERWRRLIRGKLKEKLPVSVDSGDWKSILSVHNDTCYIWDDEDKCLIAIILGQLDHVEQTLLPTYPPIFEVRDVRVNAVGHMVALSGRRGVAVLDLPINLATARPTRGRTFCRTIPIAERLLSASPQIQVLEVKWHPGSESQNHVVVLFTDNYLRVFDVHSSLTAVQAFQLGQVPTFRLSTPECNRSSLITLLGDTVVDFDFGNSTKAPDESFLGSVKTANGEIVEDLTLWPVYVLRGNGDVYALHLPKPEVRGFRSEVNGPLTMYPSADDNYGVDACTLLCLPSTPSVLIVATCAGNLYHCVVLERGFEEDDDSVLESTWANFPFSKTLPAPNCSLYVYESVELQLHLTTESGADEILQEDYTYPIRLYRDQTTITRYHCSHGAGVHSVALPLIPQLENFIKQSDEEAVSNLATIENQECVVEHLVCTQPLSRSPRVPIVGLVVVHSEALGGSTLLGITCNYDEVCIPLVSTFHHITPRLLVDDELSANSFKMFPEKESFISHIKQILRRNVSNPILKSSSETDPTPQELVQVLGRVTQVLREEYIQKFDQAREEILRRVKILKQHKNEQLKELDELYNQRISLTKSAETLVEKYDAAREQQVALLNRISKIMYSFQKQVPVLSDAEQSMSFDLREISTKLRNYESSLKQFKSSSVYAKSIGEPKSDVMLNLNTAQSDCIKETLDKQGKMIADLIQKVNMFQKEL